MCFPLMRYTSEVVLDGRWSATSKVGQQELCVVPARRQPWGVNKGRWRSLHVYLPVRLIADVLEAEDLPIGEGEVALREPTGFRDAGMEQICSFFALEVQAGHPFARLRIDCLAQDLAIQLLRRHSSIAERTTPRVRGGLSARQLRRACDFMSERLDGQVTLAELAGAVGCSPTHFSRAFKQSTGIPPFAWLNRERLERARTLLTDPKLALTDIASAVGFSTQSHFTTAFRRTNGLAPGEWRRQRSI